MLGVDPSSIELTVEKDVLTVSAERRWQPGEGDQVLVAERPQRSFSRQLFLGEGLDADRIEASYDNGVLSVTIPVAERAKPHRVEIAGGGGKAKPSKPSPRPPDGWRTLPAGRPRRLVGSLRPSGATSSVGPQSRRALLPSIR